MDSSIFNKKLEPLIDALNKDNLGVRYILLHTIVDHPTIKSLKEITLSLFTHYNNINTEVYKDIFMEKLTEDNKEEVSKKVCREFTYGVLHNLDKIWKRIN